jgi:hypothetical protein
VQALKPPAAFGTEVEASRIDNYLDQLRDSLKDTNEKFVKLQVTCLVLFLSHYLFLNAGSSEISIAGLKISDLSVVKRWFLVLPALLFCVGACYGYLRVYQQSAIERLLVQHHLHEYRSGIYRLTWPTSFILGIDLMRRGSMATRVTANAVAGILIFGTYYFPVWYAWFAYSAAFAALGHDIQLVISAALTGFLFIASFLIMNLSQKIDLADPR